MEKGTRELINDKRLTPTMERIRSSRTQLFREKNKNDRTFIDEDNCDVSLEHENKEMYAELIDKQWYWVNGCGSCNGEGRGYGTYIECDAHDVCKRCSVSRKEIEGAVWGGSEGWVCIPCHEAEQLEIRRQAFEQFNNDMHEEHDFHYMDEIKCPHCGSKISNNDMHKSQDIECHVCKGEISLEIEYTAIYSTSIKGERVTE